MTFTPISSSHLPSNAIMKAFHHYVDGQNGRHIHDGINGHGKTRRFVCRKGLKSFWTSKRIAVALGLEDVPLLRDFLVTKTRQSYIKVLSILCYIGYPGAILALVVNNGISDADLPISPATHDAKHSQKFPFHSKDLWRAFFEAQWIFAPVIFQDGTHKAKLLADQILPIRHQDELPVTTGRENTKIYKVTLHSCCNGLAVDEVVFKTMKANVSPRLGPLWEREASAYAKIFQPTRPRSNTREGRQNSHHPQGVVKCFGSFAFAQGATSNPEFETQNCEKEGNPQAYTHFLILEYAPSGTLDDFLQKNASLISSLRWENQRNLWCQLFNILVGLQEIADLNLTHQDIKLSNFLDAGTDLSDTGKPRFKLADFGTAVDGDTLERKCSFGNHTHMAPECIGGPRFPQLPEPKPFTPQADIWALGCMLSSILVQCRFGQKGVDKYELLRGKEIASSGKPIRDTGWHQGYHDGVERLSCVDEIHRRALEGCPQDSIWRLVSRIILDMMLQPFEVRRRVTAGQIRAAWLEGLERLEKKRCNIAISELVVVRRTAPSSIQGHRAPGCFVFSKAIATCPSSFMMEPQSPPVPVRWEFSGHFRWSLNHPAPLGWTSIILTETRTPDYWEEKDDRIPNHHNLAVASRALVAPSRQPTRKSHVLDRYLENVLLMVLVWLGYSLMNAERPLATRSQCPFTRDKVNINERGQSTIVCP